MTVAVLGEVRGDAPGSLEPTADMSDGGSGNGQSKTAPICAFEGCDNAVVPGSAYCGLEVHSTQTGVLGHDPGDGPDNSGPDGTWSDGTWTPSDPNAAGGWSDGTGRAWTPDGELRVISSSADTIRVSGTAIVYSPWTTIYDEDGPFKERVLSNAINAILDNGSERYLLLNHDWSFPLASTRTGKLQLRNTPDGLQMAADLDAHNPIVQHVASAIDNETIRGMSFAFSLDTDGDAWDPSMTRRTITRFRTVPEVTVCSRPAYPTTNVKVVRALQRLERMEQRGKRLRRDEQIRRIREQYRRTHA